MDERYQVSSDEEVDFGVSEEENETEQREQQPEAAAADDMEVEEEACSGDEETVTRRSKTRSQSRSQSRGRRSRSRSRSHSRSRRQRSRSRSRERDGHRSRRRSPSSASSRCAKKSTVFDRISTSAASNVTRILCGPFPKHAFLRRLRTQFSTMLKRHGYSGYINSIPIGADTYLTTTPLSVRTADDIRRGGPLNKIPVDSYFPHRKGLFTPTSTKGSHCHVVIKDVPPAVTTTAMMQYLQSFGPVESLEIARDTQRATIVFKLAIDALGVLDAERIEISGARLVATHLSISEERSKQRGYKQKRDDQDRKRNQQKKTKKQQQHQQYQRRKQHASHRNNRNHRDNHRDNHRNNNRNHRDNHRDRDNRDRDNRHNRDRDNGRKISDADLASIIEQAAQRGAAEALRKSGSNSNSTYYHQDNFGDENRWHAYEQQYNGQWPAYTQAAPGVSQ